MDGELKVDRLKNENLNKKPTPAAASEIMVIDRFGDNNKTKDKHNPNNDNNDNDEPLQTRAHGFLAAPSETMTCHCRKPIKYDDWKEKDEKGKKKKKIEMLIKPSVGFGRLYLPPPVSSEEITSSLTLLAAAAQSFLLPVLAAAVSVVVLVVLVVVAVAVVLPADGGRMRLPCSSSSSNNQGFVSIC